MKPPGATSRKPSWQCWQPCQISYTKIALSSSKLWTTAAKSAGIKLAPPLRKAILTALGERDESAAICLDKDGNPEPDPELRDTENVPLDQGYPGVILSAKSNRYVPDAWVNAAIRDSQR